MLKPTARVLLFATSTSALAAQAVTATASLGAARQIAYAPGVPSQSNPAGSPILPVRTVAITSNQGGSYSAHSSVSFTSAPYEQRLTFQNGARGATAGPQGAASARCHAVITMQCAQPIGVTITAALDFSNLVLSTTAYHVSGSIDVGDDGTHEATWQTWWHLMTPAFVTATLPAGTNRVAFHAEAGVNVNSFVPFGEVDYTLRCTITPWPNWASEIVAPACDPSSPMLIPQPTFDRRLVLQLAATPPPSTTIGALVLGFAPTSLLLQLPPGCTLGCRPDAVGLLFLDPLGNAAHTIDLQPLSFGTQVYAQGLTLGRLGHLRASELRRFTRL